MIHPVATIGHGNGFTPDRFMADVIKRGDTVLLVGVRPGNIPTVILEHPQVCYWPSGSRQISKGSVPVGTGAVLFSKWVSHTDHRRIKAQADKLGAYCPAQLLGTGEMRVLLTTLVPRADDHVGRVVERLVQEAPHHPSATPAREEAPAATTIPCVTCDCGQVPGISWGGSTREFVELHWQHDVDRSNGWQVREAERLHRLAGQHGLSTSLHYLQSLVSQLNASRGAQERDEERLSRERANLAQQALAGAQAADVAAHAPGLLVPPVAVLTLAQRLPEPVPAPEPTAATVKADEQRLGANLSELVRMLDDASAVLSLARETVLDLAQQNAKLQQSRDQLRARVNRLFDEGV